MQPPFTPYADPSLFLKAPDFPAIKEDAFLPHVRAAIDLARERVDAVRQSADAPTYDNTVTALEHATAEMDAVLGVFYTLLSAESTEILQNAAQDIGPLTAAFSNDVTLDPVIFKRIDTLWSGREALGLDSHRMAVLEKTWTGFVRNGARLNNTDKQKLRDIDARLATLAPKFSDNVRQSANAFSMHVTDEASLSGLPDTARAAAREAAEAAGHGDGWLFTLDYPSYIPFMTYADDAGLREKMWRAFTARALGDTWDNNDNVREIATLRNRRARLLGYATHADYVMERRMAQSVGRVREFLQELESYARPAAARDLETLAAYARQNGAQGDLKPWDIAYWSEKLKKAEYDFDEEDIRPYFPLDAVINGVFDHSARLFGIRIEPIDGVPVYAPGVRTYRVVDGDGSVRGLLYADFHPRPGKRQGAWQSTIRDRDTDPNGSVALPLVSIVMNFTKPTRETPSLLSLQEVETLFHEFGHALHSLLTDIDHGAISGTSVYWDFVELPSQLMENWLGEAETLNLFARHYETGEPIPESLIARMKKAKNFMKGWQLLRQLTFCALDMAWYSHPDPETVGDVQTFEQSVIKPYALLPYEGGCISTSFDHIFGGGYGAGYYSYLWAQVLDADAFEAFVENGLYDGETGKRFRLEILAKGGSAHPMDLYRNFRGREPDPKAMLRRDGLLDERGQAA